MSGFWRTVGNGFARATAYSLPEVAEARQKAEAGILRSCAAHIEEWAEHASSMSSGDQAELAELIRFWRAKAEVLHPKAEVKR